MNDVSYIDVKTATEELLVDLDRDPRTGGALEQVTRIFMGARIVANACVELKAENAKLKAELQKQVVWADDATPFAPSQIKDLLAENERLRTELAAANANYETAKYMLDVTRMLVCAGCGDELDTNEAGRIKPCVQCHHERKAAEQERVEKVIAEIDRTYIPVFQSSTDMKQDVIDIIRRIFASTPFAVADFLAENERLRAELAALKAAELERTTVSIGLADRIIETFDGNNRLDGQE